MEKAAPEPEIGETVYGLAWEINRRLPEREGKWPNFETLMVSKDVFEFEDDAKRDAVRTLESFGCCEAPRASMFHASP